MSGEKTYCIALTVGELAVCEEVLGYMAGHCGLQTSTCEILQSIESEFTSRIERIRLEEEFPTPAPSLPVLSVKRTPTSIKFGGVVQ